jgi:hypothetical protein
MAQTPKKPRPSASQGAPGAPLTRRGRARWQRERDNQRRVTIAAGVAITLAVVAILGGVVYDRVWLPSRPVAQANGATLSRGDYNTERRHEIARNIAQTLQLLATFGSQLGDQFTAQTPSLNSQVPGINTASVDDATVSGWIDRQLIIQGADGFKVQASDGEIAQQLVGDLVSAFPPPAPPLTSTATTTGTTVLTNTTITTATTAPTSPATSVATTGATSAPTAGATTLAGTATTTPSGPTATTGPTDTPLPTVPPTPTPLPDAALQEQDGVVGRIFDAYVREIQNADPQSRTNLTIDDFKAGLHDQYLRQTLTNKIEEQLVPEASFTPTTDPSSITTRHILINVTVPISATDAEREAAYAARKPVAQAILDQLHAGANFADLAKAKSDDLTTRNDGGVLPAFDKDGKTQEGSVFDPAFVKAALALKENETSDLVRTPFGWHIIQVTLRKIDSKEDQLKAARSKAFDEWLQKQRDAAKIEHFPPVTPTPTSPPTPTQSVFPTVPLGGEPTAVPTSTATLTGTATLTATATPTSTAVTSTAGTGTPLTIPGGTTPTALPPTPTETPRP